MHGKLNLSVRGTNKQHHQFDYYQKSPLRAFFPKSHSHDSLNVILANTSGGIVGGDRLEIDVEVNGNSSTVITSQAAEKVYRSTDSITNINLILKIGSQASLKWIPHETIFFDGVRLRRRISIDVAKGGVCMAGEMLVFGRTARGEHLTHGLLHDEWLVRYGGRLEWADSLHLDGDLEKQFGSPVGFNGSMAMATLIYAASDTPKLIDLSKSLIQTEECWSGSTLMGSVIISRWLGRDAEALRRNYLRFVESFSEAIDESQIAITQLMNV